MTRSTLTDVARAAGVSVASASRVLNGMPASEEMRQRVQAAVLALDYRPDAAARSLKNGRTEQIAMVVDDLGNPAYIAMMRGVERVTRAAGYRLQLSSTGPDPDLGLEVVHAVARGYADGLIICPLRMSRELVHGLQTSPVPVVVIGGLPRGVHIDNISADSVKGVELALEHLHGLGRRRIAFVGGPLGTTPGDRRLSAYEATVRQLGLPDAHCPRVLAAGFTFEAGLSATTGLLAHGVAFDSLLCANDLIAIGAMRVLADAGVRVPDDVCVVGMDDSEACALCTPTLTSVSLEAEKRGERAAQLLLRRIGDRNAPTRRLRVPPSLAVRGSTAVHGAAGRRGGRAR
jgi:LacI family transcriptional regulator